MSDLATEMVVPDVLGSFTGYRAWRWNGVYLLSYGFGHYRWRPGRNKAECNRQHLWDNLPLAHRVVPHEAHEHGPLEYQSGCHCGFYSLADVEQAVEHFYSGGGGNSEIAGAVKLTGKVIPGVDHGGYGVGFKSQYAEIIELWKPENMTLETAEAIQRAYPSVRVTGIPAEVRAKRWNRFVERQRVECRENVAIQAACVRGKIQTELVTARVRAMGRIDKRQALSGYRQALVFVRQARRKGFSRPIARNTRMTLCADNKVAVCLHSTDVATYTRDGVILRTGGWYTGVTRDRINAVLTACTDYQVHTSGRYSQWNLHHSDEHLGWGRERRNPFGSYKSAWNQACREFERHPQQISLFGVDELSALMNEPPKSFIEYGYLYHRDATKLERKIVRRARRIYNAKRAKWIEKHNLVVPFEEGILVPYKGGRI